MPEFKLSQCDIVTVYDPARTRMARYGRNARNAIMTTACTPLYDILVLDYFAARASFEVIYEALKTQVTRFHPKGIYVEDVAVQIALGDAFELLAKQEKFSMPPIESVRPDTAVNKEFRIKTEIQRVAAYGHLYIQQHHYELVSEWNAFPNGKTVDILDVLAYGIQVHNVPLDAIGSSHNDVIKQRIRASRGLDPGASSSGFAGSAAREDSEADDPRYRVRRPPTGNLIRLRVA